MDIQFKVKGQAPNDRLIVMKIEFKGGAHFRVKNDVLEIIFKDKLEFWSFCAQAEADKAVFTPKFRETTIVFTGVVELMSVNGD